MFNFSRSSAGSILLYIFLVRSDSIHFKKCVLGQSKGRGNIEQNFYNIACS